MESHPVEASAAGSGSNTSVSGNCGGREPAKHRETDSGSTDDGDDADGGRGAGTAPEAQREGGSGSCYGGAGNGCGEDTCMTPFAHSEANSNCSAGCAGAGIGGTVEGSCARGGASRANQAREEAVEALPEYPQGTGWALDELVVRRTFLEFRDEACVGRLPASPEPPQAAALTAGSSTSTCHPRRRVATEIQPRSMARLGRGG